ncbi:unnamed protein product, partial [marine sediment metagenome]
PEGHFNFIRSFSPTVCQVAIERPPNEEVLKLILDLLTAVNQGKKAITDSTPERKG